MAKGAIADSNKGNPGAVVSAGNPNPYAEPDWKAPADIAAVAADAVAVGGQLSDDEKISGAYDSFPLYAVVGAGSDDVNEWREDLQANISRAGMFRFKRGGDLEPEYIRSLFPAVVLDARVKHTAFLNNRPFAVAMSTRGIYDPRFILPRDWRGMSAEDSPLWPFREDAIHPHTGQVVQKKEKLNRALVLYFWNPRDDPGGKSISQIQFSGSSVKAWQDWAGKIEASGAKVWTLLVGLRTKHNQGAEGKADFFTPEIAVSRALNTEEFGKAQQYRDALLGRLGLAQLSAPALPPPNQQLALSAEIESEDVFADQ